MNEDQEAQKLTERFLGLPDPLQELMLDETTAKSVARLGGDYQIPKESEDLLMEEIGLVLLGEVRLEHLKGRLLSKLQLPQHRVTSLVADLDKNIFSSVHHLLIPKITEPAPQRAEPSATSSGTSLADQVAQFQERKKQKEAEQQKLNTPIRPNTLPPVAH